MSDDQAERMITLLTAMLGEMSQFNVNAEQIRSDLADTGQQLAQLLADEYVETLANTQAQGRA